MWFGQEMGASWTLVLCTDMKMRPNGLFSLVQSKVGRRLFAIFMLCAALPICVLGDLSFWQVSRKLQSETYQDVRHASKNAGMSLLETLSVVRSELRIVAETQTLGEKSHGAGTLMGETQDEARVIGLTFYGEKGRPEVVFGEACPQPYLTNAARAHLASGKALLSIQMGEARPRIFMTIRTALVASKGVFW